MYKRIPEKPPFPRKREFNLTEPDFEWLHEDEQMKIIKSIPAEYRPIFLWLKYHYRRPAEGCALQWRDYDEINRVFVIRRSISARKLVESTKTYAIHYQPCDPEFNSIIKRLQKGHNGLPTDFIFQNPRARRDGKRYTNESLNTIWKEACKKTGISIPLYSGLKHSACSQFVNDKGGTIDELQMLTDHKRRDSVLKYAKIGVERKRQLMIKRKVIRLEDYKSATNADNS